MPKQEFPFPMPNGWFCITRSHELKVGEVKSLKFCEKDVVAFRTENGIPTVLDAFCPHLRCALGEGGCVKVKPSNVLSMHGNGMQMEPVQKFRMLKIFLPKPKKLKSLTILC